LALTAPLWYLPYKKYKILYLAKQYKRICSRQNEHFKQPPEPINYIKMGLIWGAGMEAIFSVIFPIMMWMAGVSKAATILPMMIFSFLVGLPLWLGGGLLMGFWMKKYIDVKGKPELHVSMNQTPAIGQKLDEHYINPKLAQIYDLDSAWSQDRDYYLNLAGETPKRILDLGCGTGLLCDAYAKLGHKVTGVDPAEAMLNVARKKPKASDIEWVLSKAQDFKSPHLFDLIIMTGHAFQVLLTDQDVITVFKIMKEHLQPDGLIVFESRNPKIDWSKDWNYEFDYSTADGTVRESRKFEKLENSLMTFSLEYKFPYETLVSESLLRFWTQEEIEQHVASASLAVEKISGDWLDEPFEPNLSKEMIFWVRSALPQGISSSII